jgi:hypothetical protein
MINGNSNDSASAPRSDDQRLSAELVETYVSGGKLRPLLPTGRRNEIVALLTGLMADRDRFDAYIAGLSSELEHHHVRLHLLQKGGADLELPAEAIAREGFGSVSDDQLADIALSPEALEAIQEHLDDPETEEGEWLTKAISAVEKARPDAVERAEAARQVYDRLRNAGLLEATPPSTLPLDKSARSRRLHLPRWLGQSLGLAASLLLGFVLGMQMRGVESDLDATGTRVTPGGALGGQAWTIEVPSDRRAFVTIALFGPNNIPDYYPESGRFLESQPGKPLSDTIQANAGDSIFVILTETPATDVLNNVTATAVNTRQQTWRDADSFRAFLETTLRSLGFRHFAVRRIVLTR